MIDKNELIDVLREIASYERGFKQVAFDNAATAISTLDNDKFKEYIDRGCFTELRGVGKSVEKCIVEFINEGTVQRLEEHRQNNNVRSPFYDF